MGEPVTETYPDLISLCKAAQERGATMVRPDPSEDDFNTVWFYSWNVCYGHAVMGLRQRTPFPFLTYSSASACGSCRCERPEAAIDRPCI